VGILDPSLFRLQPTFSPSTFIFSSSFRPFISAFSAFFDFSLFDAELLVGGLGGGEPSSTGGLFGKKNRFIAVWNKFD
jgi:hypothetical protein